VKQRAYGGQGPEGAASALGTLQLALRTFLRLFAPFLPYVTEEVWSWSFAEETGCASIHRAPWPTEAELRSLAPPAEPASFALAAACWRAINKAKADAAVSVGREVEQLVVVANGGTLEKLAPSLDDVLAAARCRSHRARANDGLEDGEFRIEDPVFAERAAASEDA